MSALELTDVVVDYERRGGARVRAVAGASITVDRGQIIGLVGESGCGKSTLARAAVGLVRPTSGSVVFEGREIVPLGRRGRPRELARLQLVFQNPYASLNPRRKVGLNSRTRSTRRSPPGARGPPAEAASELVGPPASAAERLPARLGWTAPAHRHARTRRRAS
jgi:peptide/nickel transport system ATP-binding protein